MKTLALSLLAVAGLALVGWQHQQLGQLQTENVTLQQSVVEANQLKADLAKFNDAQAQDAAVEIDRLHEENRDLLKLRNEVNQLRDTRAEFQKVSAENQRLRSQPGNTPQPAVNQMLVQPIVININGLYDRGLNTPEDTVQTFFWAQREGNANAISRCVTPQSWNFIRSSINLGERRDFGPSARLEIVARREVNTNTVQLGLVMPGQRDKKMVYTFILQNGEWKLDVRDL